MSLGKLALMLGLVLGAGQPALCSLFTGSSYGFGVQSLNGWALNHNWDTSGLAVVDTPDGMKITGSMSATITETDPFIMQSTIHFVVYRLMATGSGLDLTLLAQQTGTLSYTGDISVTLVRTVSSVNITSCSTAAFAESSSGVGLNPGSIAAGPNEYSCYGDADGGTALALSGTISYLANGPGTISIDFGNSLLGEVRLNADTDVPEPSTLWLLSTIIPIAIYRRRHQPICRIRS